MYSVRSDSSSLLGLICLASNTLLSSLLDSSQFSLQSLEIFSVILNVQLGNHDFLPQLGLLWQCKRPAFLHIHAQRRQVVKKVVVIVKLITELRTIRQWLDVDVITLEDLMG